MSADDQQRFLANARCESCLWLDTSAQSDRAEPDTTGMCRRRPPAVDDRTSLAMWPLVDLDDWCGDWVKLEKPVDMDALLRSGKAVM